MLQLSQAEQQPLLLLDEPTSAQDLQQQHNILQLTRNLSEAKGYEVAAILHDLNQALRYCHQCQLLQQGELIIGGKPSEVLTSQTIKQVWQYQAKIIQAENTAMIW